MVQKPMAVNVYTQGKGGRRTRLSKAQNYRAGKKYFRGKSRGGSMGINKYMPFWAGAAIGFSNLDDRIPAQYTLLAATAPISGGGIGKIKAVAQGIVFGNIIQNITSGKTSIGGSSSNAGFGI
jgi:hypothetical protein